MRLLFVTRKLDYASATSYTLDLALALRGLGDEVRICTTGGPLREQFRQNGLGTYSVKFNFFSFRKLLQFLREYRPDLIHVQNLRSALFGQKISSRLRVPHVVTVHRVPDYLAPRLPHPLLAGVVAASEAIRESLVNDGGIAKPLVRVIPHGVNVEALRPDEPGPPVEGEITTLPVVGVVGRLARIKGCHIFLQAARLVLDSGFEAMFAIIGEGEEETALRRQVRELRLGHHVTFSAHLPSRRELYRVIDVVVVPTLRGGVGASALEAMAMSKPVIASAVGEVIEIVEERKNGLLVPEGDPGALARAIAELLRDQELARSLGREARRRVVESFSLSPMVQATRSVYEEFIQSLLERPLPRA